VNAGVQLGYGAGPRPRQGHSHLLDRPSHGAGIDEDRLSYLRIRPLSSRSRMMLV
jgi:hypothetical protein